MKKLHLLLTTSLLCTSMLIMSCRPPVTPSSGDTNNSGDTNKPSQDNNKPTFTITGGGYEESDGKIELTGVDEATGEGVEYIISGVYEGQIVSTIKGTKIKLNGVTLSNKDVPAIFCEKKCEISTVKDTVNTITMTGTSEEKTAAILGGKLELGGSGKCTIKGDVLHGVKGTTVTFKGSGKYEISGTADGSAVNCNVFEIGAEKTVDITLSNAKNGIKADENVTIESGTLHITDCATAIKTDKIKDDDPAEPVDHFIKISNAKIYLKNISGKSKFSTEGDPQIAEGCVIEE